MYIEDLLQIRIIRGSCQQMYPWMWIFRRSKSYELSASVTFLTSFWFHAFRLSLNWILLIFKSGGHGHEAQHS